MLYLPIEISLEERRSTESLSVRVSKYLSNRLLDWCRRNFEIRDPDTKGKIFYDLGEIKFEQK
jgi:hypothetical protein